MGCDRLTRLVGLLNRFRLEEFLEVWLTVKRALVALVIVHVKLLAALDAPEAILVPDQTLGLCLFHLEDDLATAAAVRVRVAVLTHLPSNPIIAPPICSLFILPLPSLLFRFSPSQSLLDSRPNLNIVPSNNSFCQFIGFEFDVFEFYFERTFFL